MVFIRHHLDSDHLPRLDLDGRVDGPEAPGSDHLHVGILAADRRRVAIARRVEVLGRGRGFPRRRRGEDSEGAVDVDVVVAVVPVALPTLQDEVGEEGSGRRRVGPRARETPRDAARRGGPHWRRRHLEFLTNGLNSNFPNFHFFGVARQIFSIA